MKLSLIIPACNEEAYLGATLEAARQAGDVEVVVVDNASTDRTAAVATSFRAKVVRESQRSIARARNAGAANATGDVLVFLDADTIVPERFFQRIGGGYCRIPAASAVVLISITDRRAGGSASTWRSGDWSAA